MSTSRPSAKGSNSFWAKAPVAGSQPDVSVLCKLNPNQAIEGLALRVCAPRVPALIEGSENTCDKDAYTESFYFTNVMPVPKNLHKELWGRLQDKELVKARKFKKIKVFAGTVGRNWVIGREGCAEFVKPPFAFGPRNEIGRFHKPENFPTIVTEVP